MKSENEDDGSCSARLRLRVEVDGGFTVLVEKEKHEARGDLKPSFNAPSLVDRGWVIMSFDDSTERQTRNNNQPSNAFAQAGLGQTTDKA